MASQDALLRAFKHHVEGDSATAVELYKEIIASNDGFADFANVLLALNRNQGFVSRQTKLASLWNLKAQGFHPAVVIDVGAQVGTAPLYTAFPDAHHVLLEPVSEHEPALRELCGQLRSAEYFKVGAASYSGAAQLTVTPDAMYSSVVEGDGGGAPCRPIEVITLDELCARNGYAAPYLVKIDVDGRELDVLAGASTLMEPSSVFVVESTFFGSEPNFGALVSAFAARDFVVYDAIDPLYRPSDRALWQIDLVFMHKDHAARRRDGFF